MIGLVRPVTDVCQILQLRDGSIPFVGQDWHFASVGLVTFQPASRQGRAYAR